MSSTTDPAVYYDKLTADDATMATETKLPKVVLEWAREQAEDQHVFGMIDDVTRSRECALHSRPPVRPAATTRSGSRKR